MKQSEINEIIEEIKVIEKNGVSVAGAHRQELFTNGIEHDEIEELLGSTSAVAEDTPDDDESGNDILDGNVAQITDAIKDLDTVALEGLRKAEVAGKTRKGVIKAIDAAYKILNNA